MGCGQSKVAPSNEAPSNEGSPTPSAWKENGGEEFTRVLSWSAELGGCPVRLVDARYLIKLASTGGRLARRQDLPEKAFLSLAMLSEMEPGPGDSLRVIVISYVRAAPHIPPDTAHAQPRLTGVLC